MPRWIRADDPSYPRALHDLAAARPSGISVEGAFDVPSLRVAIVGSRENNLTPVVELIERLAAAVHARRGVIVSGGAHGIDTAAHEAALAVGGRTWAVLGCGAPDVTPPTNAPLFERILR